MENGGNLLYIFENLYEASFKQYHVVGEILTERTIYNA